MASSMVEIEKPIAESFAIDERGLTAKLEDGRTITVPLKWFPRLASATPKDRGNWRFIGGGAGLNWPDLDEDISVEGLIAGKKSAESESSFRRWLKTYSDGRIHLRNRKKSKRRTFD